MQITHVLPMRVKFVATKILIIEIDQLREVFVFFTGIYVQSRSLKFY